jgi:hypothetical protein
VPRPFAGLAQECGVVPQLAYRGAEHLELWDNLLPMCADGTLPGVTWSRRPVFDIHTNDHTIGDRSDVTARAALRLQRFDREGLGRNW